jgi:CheY-like chemotaxis protein
MKTVIIAVNDPHILYLLRRYAEESGFQPVSARQGQDLLPLLVCQANPALIILDVEWPGTIGPKISRRLKAEAATRNIPVVVYSSLDEPAEEWNDGVAGYLPKSVMYDDFVATLQHVGILWPDKSLKVPSSSKSLA